MSKTGTIATRVTALLNSKNWSETELAQKSGLSQPTVHRIVNGISENPRLNNLASIAKALNVSVAYLTSDKIEGELSNAAQELIARINQSSMNGKLDDMDCIVLSQLVDRLNKN